MIVEERQEDIESFPISNSDEESLFITSLNMVDEMLSLYQAINMLVPVSLSKIIQFISSCEGEGTTTIVRELAKTMSIRLGKVVLLLDTVSPDIKQDSAPYRDMIEYGWGEVIQNGRSLDRALYHVESMGWYISPISKDLTLTPYMFDFNKIKSFCEQLRKRFDIILINSPAVTTSHDALALCPTVDGIIMVIEADKTSWKIADKLKEKVIKSGGKIIGIVFNKRKKYIPYFIDNLL